MWPLVPKSQHALLSHHCVTHSTNHTTKYLKRASSYKLWCNALLKDKEVRGMRTGRAGKNKMHGAKRETCIQYLQPSDKSQCRTIQLQKFQFHFMVYRKSAREPVGQVWWQRVGFLLVSTRFTKYATHVVGHWAVWKPLPPLMQKLSSASPPLTVPGGSPDTAKVKTLVLHSWPSPSSSPSLSKRGGLGQYRMAYQLIHVQYPGRDLTERTR